MKCASVKFLILLVLLTPSRSALLTQGPWIVNSTTNNRVHLKCANWYGAHQELFVPGGLERRSVAHLADHFKNAGINCARIPYSVEMAKYNPQVTREAVAGIMASDNCTSTATALDVMDCVVKHLKVRGIIIILNCHNSYGTWVGAGAQKHDQGLWNLPGYSTEDWVKSMETMAMRYKVDGMDLRNEIHDQDGVRITWGESNDVNKDWLAASTLAYDRLYAADPDILAIVGGLCWNFDLRKMTKHVGPIRAFDNRKLVYTVHVYPFSFWWLYENNLIYRVLTPIALSFCVLCWALSVTSFVVLSRSNESKGYKTLRAVSPPAHGWALSLLLAAGSSVYLFSFWLAMSVIYENTATSAGCTSMAEDARPYVIGFGVMVALSGLCLLTYAVVVCCYSVMFSCLRVTAWSTLWLGALFTSIGTVGIYLGNERSYVDYLEHFALNNRPVPVWVGEFGTGNPSEYMFNFLWKFINEKYNLDFAYWAFNGLKWRNDMWEPETFGLMNNDYSDWRFHSFFKDLYK